MGDKYKKLWKGFKKKYGEEYIIFEGGDSVKDTMDEFEENYLKDDEDEQVDPDLIQYWPGLFTNNDF